MLQSSNYKKFRSQYGDKVYELEAIHPEELQNILEQHIDAVLDLDLLNYELSQEQSDAEEIAKQRKLLLRVIEGAN